MTKVKEQNQRLPDQDIVLEVRSLHKPGSLGRLLSVIGEEGGLIGDLVTKSVGKTHSIREITIAVFDKEHQVKVIEAIEKRTDAKILSTHDPVVERHKGGKIHSIRTQDVKTVADLRYVYTPGVARICTAIKENPQKAKEYTNIANSVGIFTNGTRVLGLGDIGVLASMPVMEGKAVLYDQFVGISAIPILVDTKDPDEFISVVERIAPTFGGIHLEDIRSPECFYIEGELQKRLVQPVMHDDQHGTAIAVLAALLSSFKLTGRTEVKSLRVAQVGLGAAGSGIARLLIDYGFNVIGVDKGEEAIRRLMMYGGSTSPLADAMRVSDIVIATTGVPGLITKPMIRKGQIILALSNPIPEIYPEEALDAGAAFASDGSSINNALAYPGVFKGALEIGARAITSQMKIAAAEAIAALASEHELVPSPLHPDVHQKVIEAVKKAAGR
jgi:malate dehydrogenase (oxaloacetate-decarboxylating)